MIQFKKSKRYRYLTGEIEYVDATPTKLNLSQWVNQMWDKVTGQEVLNRTEEVDSSNLKIISYRRDKEILKIVFQNNHIYEFKDVPEKKYDELREAKSKGKYFWKNIAREHEYEKIK